MVERESQHRQDGVSERDPSHRGHGASTELARLGRKVAETDCVYAESQNHPGRVGRQVYHAHPACAVAQVFASDVAFVSGQPEYETTAFAEEEKREHWKGWEYEKWDGAWCGSVFETLSGFLRISLWTNRCVHLWYGHCISCLCASLDVCSSLDL